MPGWVGVGAGPVVQLLEGGRPIAFPKVGARHRELKIGKGGGIHQPAGETLQDFAGAVRRVQARQSLAVEDSGVIAERAFGEFQNGAAGEVGGQVLLPGLQGGECSLVEGPFADAAADGGSAGVVADDFEVVGEGGGVVGDLEISIPQLEVGECLGGGRREEMGCLLEGLQGGTWLIGDQAAPAESVPGATGDGGRGGVGEDAGQKESGFGDGGWTWRGGGGGEMLLEAKLRDSDACGRSGEIVGSLPCECGKAG
jgi:hypothetical protein